MMDVRWMVGIGVGMGCFGCGGYAPLTQSIRVDAALDQQGLDHVQFYSNEKCVFERQVNTLSGEVVRGTLEMRAGHAVDVVKIPRHTPGVAEQAWPDRLAISFAPGATFFYGTRPGEGPESKYYLLGRFDRRLNRFVVLHGGQEYVQVSEDVCYLLVRRRIDRSRRRDRTTLPGRRVGE